MNYYNTVEAALWSIIAVTGLAFAVKYVSLWRELFALWRWAVKQWGLWWVKW